ncbi:MAG: bifunctional ornithine acetyltransferase/N-acetylglutamate synthase [Lachnospiraceae bacterium]|nr:bifunctional ornithine acetyltransferase/N-acetylglutamate synthase [Lachnospiraceae bacterium]
MTGNFNIIEGGVTAAKGFKAASCEAGIKYKNRLDMAMVVCDKPCVSAGAFTTNVVKAACVQWDKKLVDEDNDLQAIVINTGIANACTGKEGFDICRAEAETVKEVLDIPENSVAVGSTGVIGMQLPVDRITAGIKKMSTLLSSEKSAGTSASKAIMTTDTVNKETAVTFAVGGKEVTLGGMSKGSGMIHPNMCTMIGILTTDLCIERSLLKEALRTVIKDTFNMITVDGDTSTNDTVLLLASGLAGNAIIDKKGPDYDTFVEALFHVCRTLARKMAADGEGASKLFTASVKNARSKDDARTLARAIVGSNLSKAAVFGCDANFGRFLCAMGYSGVDFDQNDVQMAFVSGEDKLPVFDKGEPVPFDEDMAKEILSRPEVIVSVNMNEGDAEADAWGCDLTYDYVKINADYRS